MSAKTIVKHYEYCFDKYGDTPQGVDWPNKEDAVNRYHVMSELIPENTKASLLDFGCGLGHFFEHIDKDFISYSGADYSQKFVDKCREKYPNNDFYQVDILKDDSKLGNFDYIIANGVFTEKRHLLYNEMISYFKSTIKSIYPHANKGIAFNVMSKHVDWERNDLFHVSFDDMAMFLTKEISRNFIIRNDYGLYEYTVYVYR